MGTDPTEPARSDGGNLRGSLLVAGAALWDPNFRRSVVLVGEHTEDGALGVVLNRPSPMTVHEAVPDLAELVSPDEALFVGGPVQPLAPVVLADVESRDLADVPVLGSIGFLTGDVLGPAGVRRARVFAGYAGWAPGQLERELDEGSWIVEPALPEDVFTADPTGLWSRVLRRKGPSFRIWPSCPTTPPRTDHRWRALSLREAAGLGPVPTRGHGAPPPAPGAIEEQPPAAGAGARSNASSPFGHQEFCRRPGHGEDGEVQPGSSRWRPRGHRSTR